MSPTLEASERQRKAAYKAWKTIRRKAAVKTKVKGRNSGIAQITKVMKVVATKKVIINKELAYPKNWKQIRVEIRERARNAYGREQCECHGECLKHNGRCEEINHTWAKYRRRRGKVKIRFTIAHLCHSKKCARRPHLRAMREPCHLIYDRRCRQRSLHGGHAVRWAISQGRKKLPALYP
jgi:hypothetical protein